VQVAPLDHIPLHGPVCGVVEVEGLVTCCLSLASVRLAVLGLPPHPITYRKARNLLSRGRSARSLLSRVSKGLLPVSQRARNLLSRGQEALGNAAGGGAAEGGKVRCSPRSPQPCTLNHLKPYTPNLEP